MFINSKQYVFYMSTLLSKGRNRIMEFVVDNPTKEIKVRQLARELRLSPAHVSRTLEILKKCKVLVNGRVDLSNPYARALKIFFNVKKLIEEDVVKAFKELEVLGIGVYGSWANGTNNEDSDLDIWVKVDKHPGEMKIASVENSVRRALGRDVQTLVLAPDRIERMRKEDPIFYYSLAYGSFVISGESIE